MENHHLSRDRKELHAVRKPAAKPCSRLVQPPLPMKVYHVDKREFRRLVQRLTGAPKAASLRLKETPTPTPAPAPSLNVTSLTLPPVVDDTEKSISEHQPMSSSFGFSSPPLYSPWSSFSPLSPETMAALEHSSSTVL